MPHHRRMLTSAIAAAAAATAGLALPSGASAATPPPTTSDFDGDGYADVAVGVPAGTVGGKSKAGYVTIVRGGPKGPGAYGGIRVTQSTSGIPGTPEAGDHFGASVALEDANGDGIAELFAGAPGEDITGLGTDAGMVSVLGGAKSGPGVGATVLAGPAASAAYGRSLAIADLNGDSEKEIVVGATDKVVARVIVGEDSRVDTVLSAPMGGRAPVLTTGDFDGDGTGDLAVGYWSTDPFAQSHVRVWSWDPAGTRLANVWNTDNAGVTALAAGDFDGDGRDDLALGECREIADENIDDPCGAEALAEGGGVHVHYGAAGDFFGARAQTLDQDTDGVPGVAEDGDHWGASLAVADVDGDGRDDLIAGAPGEAIGTRAGAGATWVVYGGPQGLADAAGHARSIAWNQDTAGVPGVAEARDAFGAAVSAADHDRDGAPDVTVGAPGENGSRGAAWLFRRASATRVSVFSPVSLDLPAQSKPLKYGKPLSSH